MNQLDSVQSRARVFLIAMGLLCACLASSKVLAQTALVKTIGGAFEGYVDGDNNVSKFRNPLGLALDGQGSLLIADLGNERIRALRLSDNVVRTFANANTPSAVVVDKGGNVYVTSIANGTVSKYDRSGNFVANIRGQLVQPLALAIDKNDKLFVAELNGFVHRITTNGTVEATYIVPRPGGSEPIITGVAVLSDGRVIVSDSRTHVLWQFSAPGSGGSVFAGTLNGFGFAEGPVGQARFNGPAGIATGVNGSVVVSDRFNHRVRVVSCDGVTSTLFGIDPNQWETTPHPEVFPGWADGTVEFAESREPVGVTVSAEGVVYDSEYFYDIIRSATGLSWPASCVGSTNAVPTPVLTPNQGFFPNGVTLVVSAANSSQRFPAGVKLYYTLNSSEPTTNSLQIPISNGQGQLFLPGPVDFGSLRVKAIDAQGNASPTVNGLATVVPTLFLSKDSGYYPMGVQIEVTTTNGFPAGMQIFYTLDGQEPTTNSLPVSIVNGTGIIRIQNALADLRSLRVRGFLGSNPGPTTAGKPFNATQGTVVGEVGIPPAANDGPILAGVGATVVIPIVANLRAGQTVRSMQFVVEVVANPGSPRLESGNLLRLLPISSNDFVKVVVATTNSPTTVPNNIRENTNRLVLAYIGTNALSLANFGTVGMVALQIPPTDSLGAVAQEGDTYTIRVTNISGTGDGVQGSVDLAAMPARTITVRNVPFVVGDTAPGFWYNAGTFGDGRLDNSDVNNAVFASLGFNRPPEFTDAFEAMDAFPVDSSTRSGGDGLILIADWRVILQRSVGFVNTIWARQRISTDEFLPFLTNLTSSSAATFAPSPGAKQNQERQRAEPRWDKQVVIFADSAGQIPQSAPVAIPVYVKVDGFKKISSLQFVAKVQSANNGPGITGVTFVPESGTTAPFFNGSTVPGQGNLNDTVYVGWDTFQPSVEGTYRLGTIRFNVPATAITGDYYTIRFENHQALDSNESGDLFQYSVESSRGIVWVNSVALSQNPLPEEWQTNFFGRLNHPDAESGLDPDQDDLTNAQEYIAGTNPSKRDALFAESLTGEFIFKYPAEAGFYYTIERSSDLVSWSPVRTRTAGNNGLHSYTEGDRAADRYFYRVKQEP